MVRNGIATVTSDYFGFVEEVTTALRDESPDLCARIAVTGDGIAPRGSETSYTLHADATVRGGTTSFSLGYESGRTHDRDDGPFRLDTELEEFTGYLAEAIEKGIKPRTFTRNPNGTLFTLGDQSLLIPESTDSNGAPGTIDYAAFQRFCRARGITDFRSPETVPADLARGLHEAGLTKTARGKSLDSITPDRLRRIAAGVYLGTYGKK